MKAFSVLTLILVSLLVAGCAHSFSWPPVDVRLHGPFGPEMGLRITNLSTNDAVLLDSFAVVNQDGELIRSSNDEDIPENWFPVSLPPQSMIEFRMPLDVTATCSVILRIGRHTKRIEVQYSDSGL